jgi:hypothetical protein
MSAVQGPVLVVVSYYDARPRQDLDNLLHDLATVPAGWPFEVLVVVNQERTEPTDATAPLPGLRVLHRKNAGYNLGAWDHGWRTSPGYAAYLFLQHECRVRRPGWLLPFVQRLQEPGVGLVGERLNPAWDASWDEIERRFAGHELPDHQVDGTPAPRLATYRHFFARHHIDPGARGDHLQALVLALAGETLAQLDGLPSGRDYGEAIASEIGISKKVQSLGLTIDEIGPRSFTWITHGQWEEKARKQPLRTPRLGLGRWLEHLRAAAVFEDKPWLVLGKGPTFSCLTDEHRRTHNLFGLNHVVREVPLAIAHAIDIEVVTACRDVLAENCRYLMMPRVPHVDSAPGQKLLEEYFDELPELYELERRDRLVWYHCSTARSRPGSPAGSPVIEVRKFSSEAAFGILAAMGARTIRSLGIDGGRGYSQSFADLATDTRLQNGQPMFDLQFEHLDRIVARHRIDYAPLTPPTRICILRSQGLEIAATVLEYSIRKHTSFPVEIVHVRSRADAPSGMILVDASALATGDVTAARRADGNTDWLRACMDCAPWLQPDDERGAVWLNTFAEAVNTGLVSAAMVRRAVKHGYADPRLLALPSPRPPATTDDLVQAEHRLCSLHRELANLRLSRTWQFGRLLMQPPQLARRLMRRGFR